MPAMKCNTCGSVWYAMGALSERCMDCGATDIEIDTNPPEDEDEPDDDECPTCKGRCTVNPLTSPPGFFCVGSTDCPTCDGTGHV